MNNKATLYRVVFFVSVIIDILFLFLALICIILGKGNIFEWIMAIFIGITLEIPTNIIFYQRMRKNNNTENLSNS